MTKFLFLFQTSNSSKNFTVFLFLNSYPYLVSEFDLRNCWKDRGKSAKGNGILTVYAARCGKTLKPCSLKNTRYYLFTSNSLVRAIS